MTKKIKLAEAARDLKIENQEIIDLMEKYDGTKRKNTTSLSAEELNYILEHYSQNNQVKDFNAYFESKNKPIEEKPAEEVKKPAVKKEKPKKEKAAKKTEPNNETPKAKKEIKPAESKKEAVSVPKTEKSAEKKITEKSDAEKKADKFKRPEKPVQNKKQAKQQPKPQKHGEKQKIGTAMSMTVETTTESNRRTVDTRGSYVNLDKYNERYEQIAPANKHKDNYSSKKQKINQKSAQRNKNKFSSKRETEAEKLRRLELERARKQQLKVLIPDEITVGELAARLKATATDVIKKLMGLGVMATINEVIDFDTAALVADEMGAKVEKEVIVTIEERLIDDSEDDSANTEERSPVVVVMGHVDHGKTSLLDCIRNSSVVSGEAGGITQHIGAYQVTKNGEKITFIDTPGHAAFTAMRARGAKATDIAILVVAADDGIMPQTIEAINHIQAAGVPMIVAVNKIDKPEANIDRVKQQLAEHNVLPEEWGGDAIIVPVSAKTKQGIDDLLGMILLVAEMQELKANPDRLATGVVLEASLDKNKGPIATILVQNGTLKTGDTFVCGLTFGKVRAMYDENGRLVKSAGPSCPVSVLGFDEVPNSGDMAIVIDEKFSKKVIEERKDKIKLERASATSGVTLDDFMNKVNEGKLKNLNIIIKADVQGSVEALRQTLTEIENEEAKVVCLHAGAGAVTESDVLLASASRAVIIAFNVKTQPKAKQLAEQMKIEIKDYDIIYQAVDDLTAAINGMLTPKYEEKVVGHAEVRMVFKLTGVGQVVGSYITDGKAVRHAGVRITRGDEEIGSSTIESLKIQKDDKAEVNYGYECGIKLKDNFSLKEGDRLEIFVKEQIKR